MDVFWAVLVFGSCVLLAWFGFRIEPHWVSKDGQRFICNSQRLNGHGEPQTRWRETRVILNDGNRVQVDQKRIFGRRSSTFWKIASQSDDPPRNREIFVFTGFDDTGAAAMLAIRVPRKSRVIPELQRLLSRGARKASTPARENGRSADRSDPG